MEGNITVDRGPLAGAYEPNNGAFRSEGDSPSFMHQIEVGLRSLENPGYGGWGGRFVQEKPGVTNVWKDAQDDGNLGKPIWRWATAFQNDFAARAAWCVTPYRDANHPPIVSLAGPADVEAAPGATVTLDVSGSGDPDGNRLYYSWWQYREPGTYNGGRGDQGLGQGACLGRDPGGRQAGRYHSLHCRSHRRRQAAAHPVCASDRDRAGKIAGRPNP